MVEPLAALPGPDLVHSRCTNRKHTSSSRGSLAGAHTGAVGLWQVVSWQAYRRPRHLASTSGGPQCGDYWAKMGPWICRKSGSTVWVRWKSKKQKTWNLLEPGKETPSSCNGPPAPSTDKLSIMLTTEETLQSLVHYFRTGNRRVDLELKGNKLIIVTMHKNS